MPASKILLAATVSVLALGVLAGCSAAVPAGTTPGDSGAPAPAPAVTTAPAASAPDACVLVSESVLTQALGVDPGAATSKPGNGGDGSTTCTYASSDIITQVSGQADLYYPASIYDKSQVDGAVDPTAGDRGYVAAGAFLVVKGQVGVFVTGSGISVDQAQAVVAAVVSAE
ncbi:MAG: hypothetical protein ABI632_04345 [Pseudolysinimonas sp.]